MNCIVLLLLFMYIVYYSPLNLLDIGLSTNMIIIIRYRERSLEGPVLLLSKQVATMNQRNLWSSHSPIYYCCFICILCRGIPEDGSQNTHLYSY